MGGFAGIFAKDNKKLPESGYPLSDHFTKQESIHSSASAKFFGSAANPLDLSVIVADLRLDNEQALRAQLKLKDNEPPEGILAAGWKKWSTELPKYLEGDFSFAIYVESDDEFFAARDRFGIKPFLYAETPSEFVFASWLPCLLKCPGIERRPNEVMIAEYLLSTWDVPNLPEQTFFESIRRLPAAHSLHHRKGRTFVTCYWKLSPSLHTDLSGDKEYVDHFEFAFQQAVRRQVGNAKRVGCHLSGGLDSSSVSAMARKLADDTQTVPVFFNRSHLPENDETEWVNRVVSRGNYILHTIATPCPITDTERLLEILGEPWGYQNLDHDRALSEEAENSGVEVVLSGYYGDVILSVTLDYMLDTAHARDWKRLHRQAEQAAEIQDLPEETYLWQFAGAILADHARNFEWFTFFKHITQISHLFRIPKWDLFWHLGLRSIMPRPLRKLYRMITGSQRPVWWELNRLIHPDFVHRLQLDGRATQMKCAWTNPSVDAKDSQYSNIAYGSTALSLEHIAHLDHTYNIQTRYPFLDHELLEYCYGLPRKYHGRGGWDRWILREAMDGTLPEDVRLRRNKTEYSATITFEMLKHLEEVEASLRDCSSMLAPYVNLELLFEEIDWYRKAQSNSVESIQTGHRIWRCFVLGKWLKCMFS